MSEAEKRELALQMRAGATFDQAWTFILMVRRQKQAAQRKAA